MAIKLGRAFGSGMGQGGVCGALVGGYMILGLALQGETDEGRARYKTYDLVREFTGHFTARHGTIVCKDLLGGVDPSTEAGLTIEWACGPCDALPTVFVADLRDLKTSCFDGDNVNMPGRYSCLHVQESGSFTTIYWTYFQTGGGGGFGYDRVSYDGGDICDNCWYDLNADQADAGSPITCMGAPYATDPSCGDVCDPDT